MTENRDHEMCAIGTVTFMFIDIEGSTQLVERIDGDFADVLDDFYKLVAAATQARQGRVVETDGDGVFAVFKDPAAALEASVEVQRRLAMTPVSHGVRLRVRIGLHIGNAVAASGSYVGREVHRAARISDAGHGGQIVMSSAIKSELGDALCSLDWQTRDLGTYLLKGLSRPEQLFQLEVPGLEVEFPGLRAEPVMTDIDLAAYTHLL
ncbi:MAG TPA: adenylate/guanylate cyclase domain-containing protein [Acidimicrobiia bacterium]|nr:adenylate/guanylate cyclase domain-containing protein [Acidimicrobiia bacterium]